LTQDDMFLLWLVDKVYDLVNDDYLALKVLSVTEEELRDKPKKKNYDLPHQ